MDKTDIAEAAIELACRQQPVEAMDLIDRLEQDQRMSLVGRLLGPRRLDGTRVAVIQITANRLAQGSDRTGGVRETMALAERVKSRSFRDKALLEIAREFRDIGPLDHTELTSGPRKFRCLMEIIRETDVFEFGVPIDESRRQEVVDKCAPVERLAGVARIRAITRRTS